MAEANATPLTPEVFFSEKIAPQFRRRIEDLQRQILTLQQQIQERQTAQGTVRVVIEGDGGGTWCLNVRNGEMKAEKEAAFPPVMTIYQSRAYFDWAASLATDSGLFGPGGRTIKGNSQNLALSVYKNSKVYCNSRSPTYRMAVNKVSSFTLVTANDQKNHKQ